MKRCPRRLVRPSFCAMAALALLSLVPSAAAWQFDPDNPTNLPIVGQVTDPDDPTDPAPLFVPLPVWPRTDDLVDYKIEHIDHCVGLVCLYADASLGGERACGGFVGAGADLIVDTSNVAYVEVGHEAGVFGGTMDGCTANHRSSGLTIDP